jgi:tetrahydromethanopterin S-methyltransferase subunit G
MEAMRQSWTDERLDDLNQRMDNGFARVDADIRALNVKLDDRFDRLSERFDDRFDRMNERFDERFDGLNAKFDAMQRTMLQVGGAMIAALVGALATVVGLLISQL